MHAQKVPSAWEEFEERLTSHETVCPPEFRDAADAIRYLRDVLGDGYLEQARKMHKHPFVGLMPISWEGLRSEFFEWIAHLRRVRRCQNVDRVIGDLRASNKCTHAYNMIEIAGRLQESGFLVCFEPALGSDFPLRPDARIEVQATSESFFLELSCQSLSEKQLTAFEAMSACQEPVRKHFEMLKCSFRLHTIPALEHLAEII
jgi:hypothetical protein